MGRRHRPFFRICAMDSRTPRDGRSIEELGHYDPMVRNVDARTVLNVNRVRYWLSVGAQPSEKVQALLKRFGIKKPAAGRALGAAASPLLRHPRPRPPSLTGRVSRRHPPPRRRPREAAPRGDEI